MKNNFCDWSPRKRREFKEEETKVQGSKEKGKQREQRLDRAEKEEVVKEQVSQTSFSHISINSLTILTVLTALESPLKDLSIDTSHVSRQSMMAKILGRSTGNLLNHQYLRNCHDLSFAFRYQRSPLHTSQNEFKTAPM